MATNSLPCTHRRLPRVLIGLAFTLLAQGAWAWSAQAAKIGQQPPASTTSSTTWTVTIVLPPRVVAGGQATLAVLGVDGRLASGVTVEVGGERVTTDTTGRAFFTAPVAGRVLLAKGSGGSTAALLDPPAAADSGLERRVSVAAVVSLRESFSICGAGFRGDANATHVRINGEAALVLAASPECLQVLPSSRATPGPAQISIVSAVIPGGQWSATTALVSLDSEFPQSGLLPGKKSLITVRVRGSEQRLRIAVENQTPGVLRLARGDVQELSSSGGAQNIASLEAQFLRSGDFSFDAKLLPSPDEALAREYLQAALPLATKDVERDIGRLLKQLDRHRHDVEEVRQKLDVILSNTVAGDLRTILAAARTAL